MMSRDKLRQVKSAARKMDFHPTTQLIHTLVDHGLEVLDELEGGRSTQELRAELKERERQVGLALDDLHVWAREAYAATYRDGNLRTVDTVAKVRVGIELVKQMITAKGPKWRREWSWYTPRVSEEFGDD